MPLRATTSLAFAVLMLLVGGVSALAIDLPDPLPKFPYVGKKHTATFRSTWEVWRSRQMSLRHSVTNEFNLPSRPGMTPGSMMFFGNGAIYRINSGIHAGKAFAVSGEIWQKYQSVQGVNGRLGFPIGGVFFLNQGLGIRAQKFEHGQIYYNLTLNRYDIEYSGE